MWLTADRVVHTVALPIHGNASLARLVKKILALPEQRRSELDDWLFEFEENLYDEQIAPFPYSKASEAAFREVALPNAIVDALAAADIESPDDVRRFVETIDVRWQIDVLGLLGDVIAHAELG